MYRKTETFPCPHNSGVVCSDKKCLNCGWHPDVEKQRLEEIEKAGGKPRGN